MIFRTGNWSDTTLLNVKQRIFKSSVLHTGIRLNAPEEVLTASEDTRAEPLEGIKIVSTPWHSADRAIAPKFLTSVMRSRIRILTFALFPPFVN